MHRVSDLRPADDAPAEAVTWWYRRRGAIGNRPALGWAPKQRQKEQPPEVVAHSWKAQHPLHKLYRRLVHRKCGQVATVAVARELVDFLWALRQDVEVERPVDKAA